MDLEILLGAAIALPAAAAAATGRTARSRARRAEAAEADLRRLWELTGEGLCELALDGRVRRASASLGSALGRAPGALSGQRLADLAHPDDIARLLEALNPLADVRGIRVADVRMRQGDGAWRALRVRAHVDPGAGRLLVSVRPPGEPGERERSADAFERLFTASPVGMAVVGIDGVVRRANSTLVELVGEDPSGAHLETLVADDDLADEREQLGRLVAGELHAVSLKLHLRAAGDRTLAATLSASLVRDEGGDPREYLVQVLDATERERLAERVRFEAEHDPDTGLLNRRAFSQVLGHHVSYARRYLREGALVVMDVDGLGDINEAHGHAAGDAALDEVARFFTERLRETDVVGRLGGDEFGVMLAEADAITAQRIAGDLIRGAAERPVHVAGSPQPLHVSLSAGVALFGQHTATAEQLFTDADVALLDAKEISRGGVVLFDGDVQQRRVARNSRRTWAEKLRAGLESDAFLLDAQPIVDIATGLPAQYELLLRLRDDDGAIVRPNAFLYIAERYGLMRAIDEWVVRRAIALARARMEQGRPVTLAVNVSGESVADRAFLPLVVTELMDAPEAGQHLVFEITERTAVDDIDQAKRLIARLGEFGCRFALDDFGAGTGSFAYLKHLPVDFIKLDGEFTRGLPSDAIDCEIVGAVVQAARGLGKQVVAECVEDDDILQAVRGFGVELAQGLYVGRPGRASELLAVEALTARS
jgi:diguanylate cyclase (GGDEF)-like protein/PAS domain S-box-containing protein